MNRVLLIEDNVSLQDNLLSLLRLEGFDAIAATNGIEGVELALKECPDLILCDILLPGCDGYEVLRILRNRQGTANIPLIFVTSLKDASSWRNAIELGAKDYLTKPFSREALLAVIAVQIEKQKKNKFVQAQLGSSRKRWKFIRNTGQSLLFMCGSWGLFLGLLIGFKVGIIAALILALLCISVSLIDGFFSY